jgi:RHS repeat-associated protein
VWDGWSLIEERDVSGNLLAKYVHGPMIDEVLMKADTASVVFHHHDGLGSTVALTDATGSVVESYSYDAFGRPSIFDSSFTLQPSSLFSNRSLFTGREWVEEADLYDYRNRAYSAELGRFLQTDPIRFDAGDVNLYRYVFNILTSGRDPMGLCLWYDHQGYESISDCVDALCSAEILSGARDRYRGLTGDANLTSGTAGGLISFSSPTAGALAGAASLAINLADIGLSAICRITAELQCRSEVCCSTGRSQLAEDFGF